MTQLSPVEQHTIEARLAELWADIFSRPVGVDEDFFQIGGDSVRAIDLMMRIEDCFGRRVSPSEFFAKPTIKGLASHLRDDNLRAWSPLVPIQTNGQATPLYCIHPGGGDVWCYHDLSRALGPQQPCYGLMAKGCDGAEPPLTSVQSMAESYLSAIRQQQPSGPYALAGWSFGGLVAFEIACQLQREGEKVDLLAIIDSGVVYSFALLRVILPGYKSAFIQYSAIDREKFFPLFAASGREANIIPHNASDDTIRRTYDVFCANTLATSEFRPRWYTGRVVLFQGRQRLAHAHYDPDREWRQVADEVEHVWVPGTHLSLLQPPHDAVLADEIRKRIPGNCEDAGRQAA